MNPIALAVDFSSAGVDLRAWGRGETKTIEIAPALAASWLKLNTRNRSMRQTYVTRLSADMLAGRWRWTHQGIAFSDDGLLIDGQHRLAAIVESGTTVLMNVTVGVPRPAQLVVDDHARRRVSDFLNIEHPDKKIGFQHTSVAIAMMHGIQGKGRGRPSRTQVFNFLERHREAIDFSLGSMKVVRRISISAVYAVMARAFYTSDKLKLQRFADVLAEGIGDPESESSAVLLGRWLLTAPHRGQLDGRAAYLKTERALYSFLRGEVLGKLYEAREELFPLPEEVQL